MSITEGNLEVGDTGKVLDTTVVEQSDNTQAHREAVVVTDAENLSARANVKSVLRGGTGYGAQVRDVESISHLESISDTLDKLLTEQRTTNALLKGILQ
jgi:hypothetical protein